MTAKTETKPIHGADIATAKILLDIKAVNFRPEQPYIFTSGWASPVYI
ncbi:MAG: orotate phosphoribosyltransferase, partial [Alphaproteobacteria bacterium]|nr:orotate phosphoribosyltransferase [Alphaproteobacteria bacterium]